MQRSMRNLRQSEEEDRCGSASTVQSIRATAGVVGVRESPCLTGAVRSASDEANSNGGS